MQTYYINRAEEKVTQTGKQLKKLELSQEGKQYPIKGVTIWSDNPLYAVAVVGQSITCELYETDSGTPNPNVPGKNYINRTVNNPKQQQTAPQPVAQQAPQVPAQQTPQGLAPNITEMAIKTHIDQHFASLKADLKIIASFLGVEPPTPTIGNTTVPYPPMTPQNSGEVPDYPAEDINPEDIPF